MILICHHVGFLKIFNFSLINPFDPRRPLAKIFFSIFVTVIVIFCHRKLSFKPWELQTFHFLEKNFEDPPHRRFRGYEVAAKISRLLGKSMFWRIFEHQTYFLQISKTSHSFELLYKSNKSNSVFWLSRFLWIWKLHSSVCVTVLILFFGCFE